jgi:MATE family multidrug resistance protein
VTGVFGVLVSIAIWPNAALISSAYTGNPLTLAMAIPALALSCLMYFPDALQVVTAQALRARGDVWLPSGTHLASYVGIMMPLAWWLAIPMGLHIMGLVWAVVIASVVSAGLLLARFWMLSRRG